MPLLTINDPERIIKAATHGPQGLPLVHLPGTGFASTLFKFKLHGCCEVLGYQLAPRLGVPVLPAVPVWCRHSFGRVGEAVGEGRIGLAVQYVEAFKPITWEQAALQVPEKVAAALLLCMLNRDEWGQFAATEFGLVFYDLERLFPAFCPERLDGQSWDDVAREVSDAAKTYRRDAPSFVEGVLDEAARLGLTERLQFAVAAAVVVSASELMELFDLKPHPLADQIRRIAADVAVMQFQRAASVVRRHK